MLIIKPIQEINEQRKLCNLCDTPYIEDSFSYKAYDDNNFIGMAQFDIEGEIATIYSITMCVDIPDDFEGMFILSRAVLNFLDLCSVKNVKYFPKSDFEIRLAKSLGFKGEGDMIVSLEGMFESKCDGSCNA